MNSLLTILCFFLLAISCCRHHCVQANNSNYNIDKVVFSWMDNNGITQSLTETSEPWSLPQTTNDDKYQPHPYFSTIGKKRVTVSAYEYNDKLIKTEIIEFEIINSNPSDNNNNNQCSNLITNSDMSKGFQGYWTPIRAGVISNMPETVVIPGLAIRYTPAVVSTNGFQYNNTLINTKCLTSGATYEVSTQLLLLSIKSSSTKVKCKVNSNCPRVDIYMIDTTNRKSILVRSQNYTNSKWNDNGSWNTLTTRFTIPSSLNTTSTSIKSIQIDIIGYHRTNSIVIDKFSIIPIIDNNNIFRSS